jgi:hypothetical protein
MTQCKRQKLVLSRLNRRRVEADFSGGRLTSDAGLLLLREVDRKLGLLDAAQEAIPDPRNPAAITHEQRELLAQRVFALAALLRRRQRPSSLTFGPGVATGGGPRAARRPAAGQSRDTLPIGEPHQGTVRRGGFADRTSCSKLLANQFRLLLSGLAYTLLSGLRRLGCGEAAEGQWQSATLRERIIKVAARVWVSARRIFFQLPTSCPVEPLFRRLVVALCDSG